MAVEFKVECDADAVESLEGELTATGARCTRIAQGAGELPAIIAVVAASLSVIDTLLRWARSAREGGAAPDPKIVAPDGRKADVLSTDSSELKEMLSERNEAQ